MANITEADVVIIGAGNCLRNFLKSRTNQNFYLGISGISAARVYLDVHPDARMVILDRDSCVGGTWNSREIWLRSDALVRI